jgi:hypothetical protein
MTSDCATTSARHLWFVAKSYEQIVTSAPDFAALHNGDRSSEWCAHRMIAPFDARQTQGGIVPKIVALILIAFALTACNGITIGPVDHTCLSNPALGDGSGCAHGHGR